MNPNDAIRRQILEYFYDRNRHATSRFGKRGSAVKISDVKRDLKTRNELSQPEVMSNLTYLIDRDWIKTVDQQKTVTTNRGTSMPSVVTYYEIAASGIDEMEAPSQYMSSGRFAGMNIQATGSNIITLGDGNVVNADNRQLYMKLSELSEALAAAEQLDDKQKLDAVVDIETLKDQLVKSDPDQDVARSLWPRIEKAASVAGLSSLALSVGQMLAPHVG